jgi:hypothetical protein
VLLPPVAKEPTEGACLRHAHYLLTRYSAHPRKVVRVLTDDYPGLDTILYIDMSGHARTGWARRKFDGMRLHVVLGWRIDPPLDIFDDG